MKIYIDFDDVICETAERFTRLAKKLFGIDIPYSEFQFFDFKKTFNITAEQSDELMRVGHTDENLLSYEETPGASKVMNKWVDEGHEVMVITGRPFDAYEPSRKWLDNHGLSRVPLFCVDKYGREKTNQKYSYSMSLNELYDMNFDFAIEDSPNAFEHVLHFDGCTVAVFDRPWNINAELPNENFVRCPGWQDIEKLFDMVSKGHK